LDFALSGHLSTDTLKASTVDKWTLSPPCKGGVSTVLSTEGKAKKSDTLNEMVECPQHRVYHGFDSQCDLCLIKRYEQREAQH
jgi:hypothetical protein